MNRLLMMNILLKMKSFPIFEIINHLIRKFNEKLRAKDDYSACSRFQIEHDRRNITTCTIMLNVFAQRNLTFHRRIINEDFQFL